jgi:hypothetical protein
MTRAKAREISDLLYRIELYEDLIDEFKRLKFTEDIRQVYGEDIESELVAVVQPKIDALLKELEAM